MKKAYKVMKINRKKAQELFKDFNNNYKMLAIKNQ